MDININVTLDLPPGWEFDGLWFDEHGNDDPPWTADASYTVPHEENLKYHKTLLSASGHGATAQEALADIPRAIAEAIEAVTATENWAKRQDRNHRIAQERAEDATEEQALADEIGAALPVDEGDNT